ncbi:MAG: hypothetical protein JXB24_14795 [Bacteroidales bacterium]|nr:hypothetical protein [Bacteroidales bacterium]
MKTTKVLLMTALVIALSGCKFKKESERLQIENLNLSSQLAKCDSTQKEYLSILNEIETSLNSILPEGGTPEQRATEGDLRTTLYNSLTDVNNLLDENEKKYQSLRNSYYSKNAMVKDLETENEKLNLMTGRQDSTIKTMKDNIIALNGTIDEQNSKISDLISTNNAHKDTINLVTSSLNAAYFKAGNEIDLRDNNIILKTGGCLGFGRVNVLNPGLSRTNLEMLDIRERTTFTLDTDLKKVKFTIPRPTGSYEIKELNPGSVQLTVTDPLKFWEFSKYLVIAY